MTASFVPDDVVAERFERLRVGGGALGAGPPPGPDRPDRGGHRGRAERAGPRGAHRPDPPEQARALRPARRRRCPAPGAFAEVLVTGAAPAPPARASWCGSRRRGRQPHPHPGSVRRDRHRPRAAPAARARRCRRPVRAGRAHRVGEVGAGPRPGAAPAGGVELVSVDSMCVYREMDIGTAKPARGRAGRGAAPPRRPGRPRRGVHRCAGSRPRHAPALAGIEARGHRALLVGGTGLYLRAVVDDLSCPGRFPDVAATLERRGATRPGGRRPPRPAGRRSTRRPPPAWSRRNRRRIVRALEVTLGSGRPFSSFGPGLDAYPPTPFALVGIRFDPAVARRADRPSASRRCSTPGFVDEVRALARRPGGLSRTARQALGYRELLAHVEEGVPLDEARGRGGRAGPGPSPGASGPGSGATRASAGSTPTR